MLGNDVLFVLYFSEARQHGVGYFAFSTDDAERRAQQTALKNLRSETEKQQAATNAARQRRAELLNKRLRAAHNRKRARDGLPPLADGNYRTSLLSSLPSYICIAI